MSEQSNINYKQKSTDDLIKIALESDDLTRYFDIVTILSSQGTSEVFARARELCFSENDNAKIMGLDILGQLGFPGRPFADESSEILLDLLYKEPSNDVFKAIAVANMHLENHDLRLVQPLIRMKSHEDAEVRRSVAIGLSGYEDHAAIETFIELSSDPDSGVRDSAVFYGLSFLCGLDTPEIRDALLMRIDDEDAVIRAEAILGLANLKDKRAIEPLIKELQEQSKEFLVYDYLIDAALNLADERLCPSLIKFKKECDIEEYPSLDDALIACGCVEER
ncbi:MAG: HEAT repeat domain-containing protein [Armatimonadota bacterium]